jgi:2-iminobutanoate/2-iminopropanoate deaminase
MNATFAFAPLVLLLLMSATSSQAQAGQVTYTTSSGVHPPAGNYSHVAVVTGPVKTLYLSGQVGLTEQGTAAEGDFIAQVRQSLANVEAVLKSNGASWQHVVKWTWYIVEPLTPAKLAELRKLRAEVISGRIGPPPASTLVYVKALAEARFLVEIDVTAVVPQ